MAINFTPEQQEVIQLHNCNVLVSAAAGSGKTAVLVERIVQMVCDRAHPVDIDRLLIVTFTNAAASEMRERISAGIAARLRENPEDEHIQRQATLLHNAQITTIDSFSLFLVRNHFNEIGLDPAFRVADEGEIKLLSGEVLEEMLEEAYAGKDPAFTYCVEYFCPGGREKVLEEYILALSSYAASFPWPKEWLLERKKDYQADSVETLTESDYGQYLCRYIGKMLEGCHQKLEEVQQICEEPDGPYMYGELVDKELEQIEKLKSCQSLSAYAARIPAVAFGRLPSKKDDSVSPDKRELAKNLRSEVKETLQKLSEQFFATPLELAAAQGKACSGPVETLIDLVLEYDCRMKSKKQERKLIDFSDMEHYALQILLENEDRPSHVALEYRQHFHEILIDEYQDSNLVQEYLLKAISGEDDGKFNRFMVGDVKQSIYKFRLARPELFLEKYDTYGREGDCRRIDLARNFRSRTEVVNAVNDIFSGIMRKTIGGIEYDEKAALYPGASYPENGGCEAELLLVEKKGASGDSKEAEALAIAEKMKFLKKNLSVTDKATGQLRPVKYSDMVILLRSNSGWDEEFKKVLEEQGIPVYITSKTGYFAAKEIQELLNFLRVLDNPFQDIPLYSVLRAMFGGFSEEEIAVIRGGRKQCSLYEALKICAGNEDYAKTDAEGLTPDRRVQDALPVDLQHKIAGFLKVLNTYRDCTTYLPIRDLLQKLVNDFDYLNYVTALPAGSKRRANVEMLLTKASDFEKTSYFGLFHFIRYMEQLEKYDVDYGEADTLDENADVVRIMSIHKSKGLEFPVTFVAGLSKRFNMQDVNKSLIVDMDLGLATDYVNPEKRIRNKTLRRMALARKMQEDNLAEELRILYVALTRAKEKLILTGVMENAAKQWEVMKLRKKKQLSYLDFAEAGSFQDFLLPVLGQTDIKVSVVEADDLDAEGRKEQIGLLDRKLVLERIARQADRTGEDFEGLNLKSPDVLRERFAYQYPYKALEKLYTKTTVSELKIAAMAEKDEEAYHTFEEKEVVPYVPAFRREKAEVSGTVRGNAYHRVMELLDFEAVLGSKQNRREALEDFLLKEKACGRLSEEYFQAVRQDKILRFLESDLAQRMWAASRQGKLYREQPFVLGIEAKRLTEEFPEDEKVLIQGIIDVFWVENGQIVLLDYKTDVIQSVQALTGRYGVQLEYYEEALTKLMTMPVKEKVLYSFYLEQYI